MVLPDAIRITQKAAIFTATVSIPEIGLGIN